jgi:hypothetical protein
MGRNLTRKPFVNFVIKIKQSNGIWNNFYLVKSRFSNLPRIIKLHTVLRYIEIINSSTRRQFEKKGSMLLHMRGV